LIAASAWLVAAAPAWSQGSALCEGQLSPAQQERFRMLGKACEAPKPETTWQRLWRATGGATPSDALVATEPAMMPRSPESSPTAPAPAREAAHLQLYGGAGVVMARMGPSPVAATVTRGNGRGATARALALAPQVDDVARRHDIDPLLLHAVAFVESRHNTSAVSSAGARGVMQVMPATAARFGVAQAGALHHAPTNLEVSAAYLKTLQGRFGTNLPLVLAAYNAGEGAVERYGRRIPPFAETQSYVKQVLAKYQLLTEAARQNR
jgi:soluble lytic murein transglycosylase-like protein